MFFSNVWKPCNRSNYSLLEMWGPDNEKDPVEDKHFNSYSIGLPELGGYPNSIFYLFGNEISHAFSS